MPQRPDLPRAGQHSTPRGLEKNLAALVAKLNARGTPSLPEHGPPPLQARRGRRGVEVWGGQNKMADAQTPADVVGEPTSAAKDPVDELTEQASNVTIATSPQRNAQPEATQQAPTPPSGHSKGKPRNKKSGRLGAGRNKRSNNNVPGMSAEEYSSRNLYLRALGSDTTDESLHDMCAEYGKIVSAKAIMEKFEVFPRVCKGYGFVLFEQAESAVAALAGLTEKGVEASYARVSTRYPSSATPHPVEDPTNLYFSNLPLATTEKELEAMLGTYGVVVSSRILRNDTGLSRGVGFARMKNRSVCIEIVKDYNGKVLEGATEPVMCKFADNPGPRRKFQRDLYRSNEQGVYMGGADVPRYSMQQLGMGGMLIGQPQGGQMPMGAGGLYMPMPHGAGPYSTDTAGASMAMMPGAGRMNQQGGPHMVMQYAPYYGQWPAGQAMYIAQQPGMGGSPGMVPPSMMGQIPGPEGASPVGPTGSYPVVLGSVGDSQDAAQAGAPQPGWTQASAPN